MSRTIEQLELQDREDHKKVLKEALSEWLDENPEHSRQVIGEAFKDWMNEQYQAVGKWTLRGIGVMLFGVLMYWIATHGGKP
jgi:hypothetical protein